MACGAPAKRLQQTVSVHSGKRRFHFCVFGCRARGYSCVLPENRGWPQASKQFRGELCPLQGWRALASRSGCCAAPGLLLSHSHPELTPAPPAAGAGPCLHPAQLEDAAGLFSLSLVHGVTIPGACAGSKYVSKWTLSFPCVFTVVRTLPLRYPQDWALDGLKSSSVLRTENRPERRRVWCTGRARGPGGSPLSSVGISDL